MPYIEVFLPDDLLEAAVSRDLPLSDLLVQALRNHIQTKTNMNFEGLDQYIRELEEELLEK